MMRYIVFLVFFSQIGFSQILTVKENIRTTPNGNIIGQIESGTEVHIIQKEGNWAKVSITGYIWIPSLELESSIDISEFDIIIGNALRSTALFSDAYHKSVRNELKSPDFSKYTKSDFMIWAYMQSIWDKYEGLYGISGAEDKVFSNTANKFSISKSEVKNIFSRVDNAIY